MTLALDLQTQYILCHIHIPSSIREFHPQQWCLQAGRHTQVQTHKHTQNVYADMPTSQNRFLFSLEPVIYLQIQVHYVNRNRRLLLLCSTMTT